MNFIVSLNNSTEISLIIEKNAQNNYILKSKLDGQEFIKFNILNSEIEIVYLNNKLVETEEILKQRIIEFLISNNLINDWGSEDSEDDNNEISIEESPYDPDLIRVDTKQFSLRQIYDMIEDGDIDLTPDFQRNLVWDGQRKSRLIESILMRIPLPIFYFAEDNDGRISVVDGLQRLSTIYSFMKNDLKLKNLEYLEDKCCGKVYRNEKEPEKAIDGKYFRWFNSTQITVNVIDPSSPFKLKYDIFKRINTGGLPLNSQEIRNCLAGETFRSFLRKMAESVEFKKATGNSIKHIRLEDHEFVLRFILFFDKYNEDKALNNYSGNIDFELNALTERISRLKDTLDIKKYEDAFLTAMKNSSHLFGKYSFRKVLNEHLQPNARKQLINKALFVVWSVLLSKYNNNKIRQYPEEMLTKLLADEVTNDDIFFAYLTYGTNSKINIKYVFSKCEEIIKKAGI